MGKLDTLNSPGGHLSILALFTIAFCGVSVWLTLKFGPTSPAVTVLTNSFQAAFGALLLMLRGGANEPPPPPIVDSKPPSVQIQ